MILENGGSSMKKRLSLLCALMLLLGMAGIAFAGPTFYIKSQYSALYDIDPITLRYSPNTVIEEFGSAHITWDIASDDSGNIYYLREFGRGTGSRYGVGIYRNDPGRDEHVVGKDVYHRGDLYLGNARGLAYGAGSFYTSAGNVISRVDPIAKDITGTFSIPGVSSIRGLDFVSDASGAYLYATSGDFGANELYKIYLDDAYNCTSFDTITLPTSSYESAFPNSRYGSVAYGYYGGTPAFFLTKDDRTGLGWGEYTIEPLDLIRVVSAETGEILAEAIAWQSGITDPDTGMYLNWANPSGIEFVDGKLIVASHSYYNKGPNDVPEPATFFLLGSGLLGLVFAGRRKLKAG